MKIQSWKFYFSEASQNLRQNVVLALASISSAAVSLLVFGLFLALSLNVGNIATVMEGQVGIEAFLSNSVQAADAQALMVRIQGWTDVQSVTFVSKEAALRTVEKDFGSQGKEFQPLGQDNPLLNSIFIKAKTPSAVTVIATRVKALPGVTQVNYQAPVVSRLFRLIDLIRLAGLAAGALLALGTLLVIHNAIRIGIFARRREMHIMRLAGATEGFIRWPFLLEGMLLGIGGAIVAGAIAMGLYHLYVSTLRIDLPFVPVVGELQVDRLVFPLVLLFGLVIGLLGSQFSLRKVRV